MKIITLLMPTFVLCVCFTIASIFPWYMSIVLSPMALSVAVDVRDPYLLSPTMHRRHARNSRAGAPVSRNIVDLFFSLIFLSLLTTISNNKSTQCCYHHRQPRGHRYNTKPRHSVHVLYIRPPSCSSRRASHWSIDHRYHSLI